MNNKVMIDSSMLIEYIKKSKIALLDSLLGDSTLTCCICEVVVSEFLFYYLKINATASPLSVQSSKRIKPVLENSLDYLLIQLFHFLPTNNSLYNTVPRLMSKYNLLPNDAIILATCKMHNITKLASHDTDFIFSCQEEGIELLIEKD
ncbi:PIN domain-containing protein [Ilyomonas limi]|uniref:PIN domain-containing protein n=1 Tax=Ilyomonas limi TaxID=2575867 RepID=A0A4U3L2G4_9BACT|nr:PIN domain-containing protein [Ilyomonas limi]TKK67697.1 PIN domain-containing protein [Ilyomonas limi]